MAQHVHYGQWSWLDTPDDQGWIPPVTGLPYGCFDLRGVAACASKGLSNGFGFFIYPQEVVHPSLIYLGERGAAVLTPQKDAIQIDLKLGEKIVASTVADMVAELFLQHADPKWDTRWGRLRGRNWKLACQGEVWKSARWTDTDPEWLLILECLQANYQAVKADVGLGKLPPDFHRKYLKYQLEQYAILNYEDITKNSGETPLPHSTSWSETWPLTGTVIAVEDQVWTEVAGDVTVASTASANRLNNNDTSVNDYARCETTLAGDAHYCQATERITSTVSSSQGSPCTRFAGAASDFYAYRYRNDAGAESNLFKVVTGTGTSLATFDDATPTTDTDYVLRLTSTADDLHTCTKDSVDVISNHSDASITGNVLCGLFLRGAGAARAHLHAVSAADLAAASGLVSARMERNYPRGAMRGVLRGAIR